MNPMIGSGWDAVVDQIDESTPLAHEVANTARRFGAGHTTGGALLAAVHELEKRVIALESK
ncbi:hypothetical protein [Sanguibacter massiliensis]|uniref:hypothetical protein n=1 Tax=Sanguibacter massiliensis TaxID=1973217 RepID=UPI000C84151D|nr:hypothetical protein [Sanguibacter massiliensis]